MKKELVDVLVIGAGPAGCVAAAILNKNGHRVKVVEKQLFPRFVIGESLLPRCLHNFEKAGLLEAVKSQKFLRKDGAAFLRDEGEFCDFKFSEQFTDGWDHAWQMRRADLDKALADEIVRQGVELTYEESVEDVQFNDNNTITTVKKKDGEEYQIEAKYVVDASGYGRVLPRLLNLNEPSFLPARSAFFAHIKEENREDGAEAFTEVVDLKDAWVWLIPVSEDTTSVGFVAKPEFFEKNNVENYSEAEFVELLKLHPRLQERYGRKLEFPVKAKAIKGYSVSVKQLYGDKYILIGNSTEFLDPVFSAGVAFATETGAVAGELVSRHLKGEEVDFDKDYVQHISHGIDVFTTYITEWYTGNLQTIFFADQKDPGFKKQICSVLAGYVWDMSNPYVKKHKRAVKVLAEVIRTQQMA